MPIQPIEVNFLPSNVSNAEPMQVDMAVEENDNIEEEYHVVDNPCLDLESYTSQYAGLAKLYRLEYVAEHSSAHRLEALRMCLALLKETYNVQMYQTIAKRLHGLQQASNLPDAVANVVPSVPACDKLWVEETQKKAALKLEKLDTDLKNYKSNSIKESIRRGQDDLGDHYLDCGNLADALKCYSRARDYCTSSKHVIHMCLNVIKVSVYLQNWSHVLSYVSKAENTPEQREGKDLSEAIKTKLFCAAGLAELCMGKYKNAARKFLMAQFDHVDFRELLSASNVAMYSGLCALASFNREELQKYLISSSSFKLFLELEPQLREMIVKFYESNYASCLTLLDDMRDSLLLDMYLAPHVKNLYVKIRNRALVQYFDPYLSADLTRMAAAFNTSVSRLEDELMQLILDGQINARIDSHNKVLYAKDTDQRTLTFERAVAMGKLCQTRTKALILRSVVLKNKIMVQPPPKDGNSQPDGADDVQISP